jgi:hypothetical protein
MAQELIDNILDKYFNKDLNSNYEKEMLEIQEKISKEIDEIFERIKKES